MGTTNNGLHYPEAGDLVRDYPAVQRASQKAIDARISELDEGLQPVRAATDAREGGTLVKRRSDGGSNHQSLWVAEVPKNTGSVTHKGYVDDADAATLAAAKDHASAYTDEVAADLFPLVVEGWTEVPADSLLETGLYRLPGGYPKAANGWPAAVEGMAASVIIRQLWSGLIHQEVRGWSVYGGTPSYSRWVRIGGSGTTLWMTDSDRATYRSGVRDLGGSVHTDQGWNPEYGPSVSVERYGPLVDLSVENMGRTDGGADGNYSVIDLPRGFHPSANKYPVTWRAAKGYVSTAGLVRITTPGGPLDYLSITYMTNDDPPSTLPGSPA